MPHSLSPFPHCPFNSTKHSFSLRNYAMRNLHILLNGMWFSSYSCGGYLVFRIFSVNIKQVGKLFFLPKSLFLWHDEFTTNHHRDVLHTCFIPIWVAIILQTFIIDPIFKKNVNVKVRNIILITYIYFV